MNIRLLIVIGILVISVTGCYMPISGRVIDAETNAPIEGAVVLVEWTKTHGIGDHWTESYKVAETLSDRDGKFDLPGCYSPFVNKPDLTIYKKGYVAWNNKMIFPDYAKRDNYKWQSTVNYKLQKFRVEYAFDAHMSFIRGLIISGPLGNKKLMIDALLWEETKAFEERRSKK